MTSERKIGEEFYDGATRLTVVETSSAEQCISCFYHREDGFGCANVGENIAGECYDRLDGKLVAFQKALLSRKQ